MRASKFLDFLSLIFLKIVQMTAIPTTEAPTTMTMFLRTVLVLEGGLDEAPAVADGTSASTVLVTMVLEASWVRLGRMAVSGVREVDKEVEVDDDKEVDVLDEVGVVVGSVTIGVRGPVGRFKVGVARVVTAGVVAVVAGVEAAVSVGGAAAAAAAAME